MDSVVFGGMGYGSTRDRRDKCRSRTKIREVREGEWGWGRGGEGGVGKRRTKGSRVRLGEKQENGRECERAYKMINEKNKIK